MGKYLIAYDLGTGGNKASLYDAKGNCVADTFVTYQTYYPRAGWHEQRPDDWWKTLVESTRDLVQKSNIDVNEIAALGISGHSLGAVPLDKSGNVLRDITQSGLMHDQFHKPGKCLKISVKKTGTK